MCIYICMYVMCIIYICMYVMCNIYVTQYVCIYTCVVCVHYIRHIKSHCTFITQSCSPTSSFCTWPFVEYFCCGETRGGVEPLWNLMFLNVCILGARAELFAGRWRDTWRGNLGQRHVQLHAAKVVAGLKKWHWVERPSSGRTGDSSPLLLFPFLFQ